MVALSVVIHTLFLYGVRIKLERSDDPRVTLSASIAAPQPLPDTATPAIAPAVKKPTATSKQNKALAAAPVAEPVPAMPLPDAALEKPPSPVPYNIQEPAPSAEKIPAEPAPPPAIATLHERSGAKVRAPEPIENPTMPAEDVAVAPAVTAPEPQAQLPAIATAPDPIEPIGQDVAPTITPARPIENTARAEPTPPAALPPPQSAAATIITPTAPRETPLPPADIAKASPSIVTQPAPPTAMIDRDALPLPAAGEAQYKLRMGVVSGELILNWNFSDGHYRLNSVAQGTGIFAIAGKYIQESDGDITEQGLRPANFSVERRGKKDHAKFNWPESSVQFSGKSGEHTEPVSPGTQDMLSLLFQLAFTPPLGEDLTVIVSNGRKLERYAFERAGEESISLEGGTFHTLKIHKRRQGDEDGMEVWLALEHHYLPVKIRVTDKKGSVIEQSLMALKVLSAKQ